MLAGRSVIRTGISKLRRHAWDVAVGRNDLLDEACQAWVDKVYNDFSPPAVSVFCG